MAKRGYIYEFASKFDGTSYALNVSNDTRSEDGILSIIILSKSWAPTCVEISMDAFPNGTLYANCGKITYTEKEKLLNEVGKISDKKMLKIDQTISTCLGLNPLKVEAENQVYKELYHELLEKFID